MYLLCACFSLDEQKVSKYQNLIQAVSEECSEIILVMFAGKMLQFH